LGAASFEARIASATNGGNLEIRLDSPTGSLAGTCIVTGTGGWQTWVTKSCTVSGLSGMHDIYLKFTGGSGFLFNINWWKFTPAITDVEENSSSKERPESFLLEQNYPNPFNPSTAILFSIPAKSYVLLKVFDMMGREVATLANEELSGGNYSRQWNASNISSGVYFYRLQTGLFIETKKLILLR